MTLLRLNLVASVVLCICTTMVIGQTKGEPSSEIFGKTRLVDVLIAGSERADQMFAESEPGVSQVRTILDQPTRVIPNTGEKARFVSMRLAVGKGLKVGAAYVLRVEYPEDEPRTMTIHNRGSETSRGLSTGPTVGDVLKGKYVSSNPESVQYPLSGKIEAFEMLFYLQERMCDVKLPRDKSIPRDVLPADGVPVIVSQFKASAAPLSAGAAFSRVALYEVLEPAKLALKINYPPDDLPRRHLFWREEMSDNIVNNDVDPGWRNDVDWYESKAKIMQFLGMNTFTIDMLEFGHNQGWDTSPAGPGWMNVSKSPERWESVLKMLQQKKYPFTILPYYEYAGSVGGNSPGTKKLARPMGDETAYTHIEWTEKAYADVSEPAVLDDAKQVLDLTITRWKEVMPFTGAWFRSRPSHMPVSFSDNALAKFAKEANDGQPVTRDELQKKGAEYETYLRWWDGQRKAFLLALRDHLRKSVDDDAVILFTAEPGEAGISLPENPVVVDDVAAWERDAASTKADPKPIALQQVIADDLYLKALRTPTFTWGKWEWQHSVPIADPQNYKDVDGVLMTFPFNRIFTVSSRKAFDAYRNKSGLAVIRHFMLNEDEMDDTMGYFVVDVDRTRQHMMQAEILAMANGDPWYIGYLSGHNFNRGFPEYARRFNQAYLSLPALPSVIVEEASNDEAVVVRVIQTEKHGSWFSVINTAMTARDQVTLQLPAGVKDLTDAVTGQPIPQANGKVTLSLDTAEMRVLRGR